MRAFLAVSLALLSSVGLAQYPGAEPPPGSLKVGFDAITVAEAKRVLTKLASDDFEGRGTGFTGFQKAATFMADEFRKIGLKPVGDMGSYFQNLRFTRTRANPATSRVSGPKGVNLESGADIAWQNAHSADVEAPLVLVQVRGGQVSVDGHPELAGAVVVLAAQDEQPFFTMGLAARGPVAILRVKPGLKPSAGEVRVFGQPAPGAGVPVADVTPAAARRLLEAAGYSGPIEDVGALAVNTLKAHPLAGKAKVHVELETKEVLAPNVVGMLEGSDPKLRSEAVIVSAHLDHIGASGGRIYHGADDDGSGSTAVLLVAQAMKANKNRPKRSVLFVTFCGEELGLIGSGYYVSHPIVPIEDTVADLQMDMVGRNNDDGSGKPAPDDDAIRVIGSERVTKAMKDEVEKQNRYLHFRLLYDMEFLYGNSDQASFGAKGLPVAFLFDCLHHDLHQTTDTVDKINWKKLTSAAKLYYLVATSLANSPVRLKAKAG